MPFLERQRRPRTAPARTRDATRLTRFDRLAAWSGAWWPPLWGGLVLAAAAGGGLLPGPPLPGWALAARGSALVAGLLPVAGPRLALVVWVGVAVGGLWWGQGEAAWRRSRVAATASGPVAPAVPVQWEGALALRTTGYAAVAGDGRWRLPAALLAVGQGSGAGTPRRGDGIWLSGEGAPPDPGAVVRARARLDVPPAAAVPGAFDLKCFLSARGLRWQGRVLAMPSGAAEPDAVGRLGRAAAAVRKAAAMRLADLLPGREARLGHAVLLGMRTAESRQDATAFADLGLAHLFAVSGLHVGILAGLVFAPLTLLGAGRGVRAACALPAVAGFVVLTGAPGSVVRAGTLVAAASALPVFGRRVGGLRLLGIVFWAVVVWDPRMLLDAGVRLSYLAAAGIMVAHAATGGFRCGRGGRAAELLAAGLGVTLAAQWATLPVVAAAFGHVNPWSPLVNLVAVPVFGIAVWLLAAALVAAPVCGWVAGSLAALAWLLLRLLAAAAAVLAPGTLPAELGLTPPGPGRVAVWAVLSVIIAVVLRRWQRLDVRAAVVLVCIGLGLVVFAAAGRHLPPRGDPVVIQFAVGQGDCALVAFPDGWTGLIDTAGSWRGDDGPLSRGVLPWLRRQGIGRLDAVVLTHGHRDHTGGAPAVGRTLEVGCWYGGVRAGETTDTGPARWARPGPAVRTLHQWRGWTLEVVDPYPGRRAAAAVHENDRSLVVILRDRGRAALVWSGDLETAGEQALLAAGRVPRGADVWKAGHHGSNTSGSEAFLEVLRPRAVVISCGVGNRYGHPNHGPYTVGGDTLQVVRTDLQGTVYVHWKDGAPRLSTQWGGPP